MCANAKEKIHRYCFCCLMIATGNVINVYLIEDVFHPPASHPILITTHTPPPQLNINAFANMQSNRVIGQMTVK